MFKISDWVIFQQNVNIIEVCVRLTRKELEVIFEFTNQI